MSAAEAEIAATQADAIQYGLELQGMVKRYGDVEAVRGVDLAVRRGEFLTVLGPSGSGKTTILRLVAGFTVPTAGKILLEGRDVSHMTPAERGVGMVFQHYALFPHMSVADNIAYGLKMRGVSKKQRQIRVQEMLELVGLSGMGKRLPRELSGGQQQRVALARALAFGPALLLMDEPLGALDRELRIRMAGELRRIHAELGTTFVYVTHDREEALTLSDRIAIMHQGELEAVDTPPNLYTRPPSRFVASFFAGHNLLPVKLLHANSRAVTVECLGQPVDAKPGAAVRDGDQVWLAIPPRAIAFQPSADRTELGQATLVETIYMGDAVQAVCSIDGFGQIQAVLPPSAVNDTQAGDVRLYVDADRCVVVPDTDRDAQESSDQGGIKE